MTEEGHAGGTPIPQEGRPAVQDEELHALEAGLKKAIEDFQERKQAESAPPVFSEKAQEGVAQAFELKDWTKDTEVVPNTPAAAEAISSARREIYDQKLVRMKSEGVPVAESAPAFEMRETSPEELIGRAMTKEELYQALEAIPEIAGSQETLTGKEWKERIMLADQTGAKDLSFITNTYGLRDKAAEVLLGTLPAWATEPEEADEDAEAAKDRLAQAMADALDPEKTGAKNLLDKFSEDLMTVSAASWRGVKAVGRGAKAVGRWVADLGPSGHGRDVEHRKKEHKKTAWDRLLDWMESRSK